MEARTLKALRGSIEKWKRILAGEPDNGIADCPLCGLFFAYGCSGCPAGLGRFCCDDHYYKWRQHLYSHRPLTGAIKPGCKKCIRLATNVLEYLKGLMPKENQWTHRH